ncbi:MAG: hypothetical protein PHV11_07745 [Candidatus Bipolaricaulis sp.]|nr:hypothetical protein [Candidatus Bipolaricaulis sp.]
MKRIGGLVASVALLLGVATAAAAIGLCDYVSPETNLTDITFSFSYRYFNDAATPQVDASGGRAAIDFKQLYDSPDMGYTIAANGAILLEDLTPSSGLGSAAGTFRYYLMDDAPLFGFGGLAATIASGQPKPGVNLTAGVGYGRFSDTTPMAKAFTIQDELAAAGTLSGELSEETLLAMADVIGQLAEYETVQDCAAAVVETIQAATGVTVEPREVLTVEEILVATGDERNCGWSVQGGIGYELIDPYGGTRNFLVTASADAAFSPDRASQLLFHTSVTGPFNLLEENTFLVNASYDRELTEDDSLKAAYTLQRVQPLGLDASMTQSATLLVTFGVGTTDLGLQLALTNKSGTPGWSVDLSVSVAVDLSS